MADDLRAGRPASAGEEELELLEEPLVAPPEKLRTFLTRPRMFLGFALSVMVTVLITRLFSLHLRHNFGVVRGHAREPEFLAYAVLAVLVYLVADTVTLVLLTRVLKSAVRLKPLVLLSLRANFVGGTTSFGGVEIPYRSSRSPPGAYPARGHVGHPRKGRRAHVGAGAGGAGGAAAGHRLDDHSAAALVAYRRRRARRRSPGRSARCGCAVRSASSSFRSAFTRRSTPGAKPSPSSTSRGLASVARRPRLAGRLLGGGSRSSPSS